MKKSEEKRPPSPDPVPEMLGLGGVIANRLWGADGGAPEFVLTFCLRATPRANAGRLWDCFINRRTKAAIPYQG